MSSGRLRVLAAGFAGFGYQDHQTSLLLPALAEHPDFRVVAVVALDGAAEASRAARAARSLGVPVLESLEKGLARADVDCVSVSALPGSRATVLREVLRAGKHVLADQPLATTVGELCRLRAMRDEIGCVLAVAHHQRFQPMVLALAAALADGRVGLPWNAQADFLVAGGPPCPGDELVNLGLDPVDVVLALTGLSVRRVYALACAPANLVTIMLDHDNGLTSTVVAGRTHPRADLAPGELAVHRYRISGSHGTALVDATEPAVTVRTATSTDRHVQGPSAVRRLLDDWRAAVLGVGRLTVSVEESLAVLQVLDAARRSLTAGRPEDIPADIGHGGAGDEAGDVPPPGAHPPRAPRRRRVDRAR